MNPTKKHIRTTTRNKFSFIAITINRGLVVLLLISLSINGMSQQKQDETFTLTQKTSEVSKDTTILRRNSVYFEDNMMLVFTLNYERIIPFKNNNLLSFSLGAGAYWESAVVSGRVSYALGGIKHYFETGVVSFYQGEFIGGALLGYRFQGPKGLLIRVPLSITNNLEEDPVWFWFGFSIGFSF